MRKGWVDVELLVATNKIVRAPVDSKHFKCACVCVCGGGFTLNLVHSLSCISRT